MQFASHLAKAELDRILFEYVFSPGLLCLRVQNKLACRPEWSKGSFLPRSVYYALLPLQPVSLSVCRQTDSTVICMQTWEAIEVWRKAGTAEEAAAWASSAPSAAAGAAASAPRASTSGGLLPLIHHFVTAFVAQLLSFRWIRTAAAGNLACPPGKPHSFVSKDVQSQAACAHCIHHLPIFTALTAVHVSA